MKRINIITGLIAVLIIYIFSACAAIDAPVSPEPESSLDSVESETLAAPQNLCIRHWIEKIKEIKEKIFNAEVDEDNYLVKLSWREVKKADKYFIYRSNSRSSGSFVKIDETHFTTYEDSTIEPGIVYYYRVSAYSYKTGESHKSMKIRAFLTPAIAPASINASDGEYADRISLTWHAVDNIDQYYVYRSQTLDGTYEKIAVTDVNSLEDRDVATDVIYYYKVTTYSNTYGESTSSPFDSGYVAGTIVTPPAVPVNITATDALYGNRVELTWDADAAVEEYYIYRSLSINGTYSEIGTATSNSYTDSQVDPGRIYYYKVKAFTAVSGFSGLSEGESGYAKIDPAGISFYLDDVQYTAAFFGTTDGIYGQSAYMMDWYNTLKGAYNGPYGLLVNDYTANRVTVLNAAAQFSGDLLDGMVVINAIYKEETGNYYLTFNLVYEPANAPQLKMVNYAQDIALSGLTPVDTGTNFSYIIRDNLDVVLATNDGSAPAVLSDIMISFDAVEVYNAGTPSVEAHCALAGLDEIKKNSPIVVEFVDDADAAVAMDKTNTTLYVNDVLVDGVWNEAGTVLTYTPAADFIADSRVFVDVPETHTSLDGVTMHRPYFCNFEIGSAYVSKPVSFSASDGMYIDSVRLEWSSAGTDDMFHIHRADAIDGSYIKIGETLEQSYVDETVTPGITYYYQVRAYDEVIGEYSDFTDPDAGNTITAVALTSGTYVADTLTAEYKYYEVAVDADKQYIISWDDVVQGSGSYTADIEVSAYYHDASLDVYYEYFTYADHGFTEPLIVTTIEPVLYLVVNQAPASSGDSFAVRVMEYIPLATPQNVVAADAVQSGAILVEWSAVADADGYNIYRSGSLTGSYAKVGSTTMLAYEDTEIVNGMIYYYCVEAYSNDGRLSEYSTDDAGQGAISAADSIALTAADFGIYIGGAIPDTALQVIYSINVEAGKSYTINWDDSFSGSGMYTADVDVTAYDEAMTPLFTGVDSGYTVDDEQTITASTTGVVYLVVKDITRDKGTFGLKVSQL